MAQISVDARTIEDSLRYLSKQVRAGLKWVKPKKGGIVLDVPEPYEHDLPRGPLARACQPLDVCADVGILLAVYKRMHPKKKR